MMFRQWNLVEISVTGTPETRSTSSMNLTVSDVSCSNLRAFWFRASR